MSQDNNLGTSNLCTTEDAFEQFQAVAMYEEDEYITLADIVPPQPVVPDLSNELNEIPYDNEVVLSSSQSDDASIINSTVESNSVQCNEPGLQANDVDENVIEDQNDENCSLVQPTTTNNNQKVSRKKRKNENYPSYQNDVQKESVQAIQESVLSTTVGKNNSEIKNDSQEEPIYPRRTRRERIPNTSKYPIISETTICDATLNRNTSVKRRGRRKKASLESSISEPDSTNADSVANENLNLNESNLQEESLIKNEVKKGRRGKSKIQTDTEICKANNSSNDITESETDVLVDNSKKPTRRGRKRIADTSKVPLENIEVLQETNGVPGDQLAETNSSLLEENIISSNDQENVKTHDADSASGSNNSGKKSGKPGRKKKPIAMPTDCSSDHKFEESTPATVDMDLDDETDDICLSKLKENINNVTESLEDNVAAEVQNNVSENGDVSAKRNSKMPMLADFEYNIDKIVKEASIDSQPTGNNTDESLLVEDNSRRPNRRKTKQNFKYDEGSDEDPFANVELSDDEPRGHRKGRYDYDDEYIPGKKRGMAPVSSSDSDSMLNDELDDLEDSRKQKRKKLLISPRKRGRKSKIEQESETNVTNESTSEPKDGDIESCLKPALITSDGELSMKPPAEAWATSNEFENFIAQKIQGTNLKIKKVSSKPKSEPAVAPINIPVIDQKEINKKIEISTQTISTPTKCTEVQTSVPYDIPMKNLMELSSEQSQKACEFLNSVVKTTVELGQLMKDKSEDFMKKKINTENVTDTFKMDYCVRKSFLLFKLAKHNLMQMEEDLAKQYDEFLKSNNLSACREELKQVAPKPKEGSDSDCEIVEVKAGPSNATSVKKEKEKPKFNPKTVFLNKELSIKIAKKPSADKNLDIKGRHTVWINDSVMVKKVKPTQSFLAQDSRNKKPPDYITEKMVSDFFENYYRQKALDMCASYINTEWHRVHQKYVCNYFIKCDDFDESDTQNEEIGFNMVESNISTSNGDCNSIEDSQEANKPKTLSSLCTEVVHSCLHADNLEEKKGATQGLLCNFTDGRNMHQPLTLFRLCVQSLHHSEQENMTNVLPIIQQHEKLKSMTVHPLKTICYQKILKLFPIGECENTDNSDYSNLAYSECKDDTHQDISDHENLFQETDYSSGEDYCDSEDLRLLDKSHKFQDATQLYTWSNSGKNGIQSLLSLCIKSIQSIYGYSNKFNSSEDEVHPKLQIGPIHPIINSPKSLKYIAFENVKKYIFSNKQKHPILYNLLLNGDVEKYPSEVGVEEFTINSINTMSEEAFHRLDENELEDEDEYDYETEINFDQGDEGNENDGDENEWSSQVQMQELRSCITSGTVINSIESEFININTENSDQYQSTLEPAHDHLSFTPQIKLEPPDEALENVVDPALVKTEPVHGLDEMTIIPESVVTKSEIVDHGNEPGELPDRERAAFDVTTFEQFVRNNKMMRSVDETDENEEIFSQSGLRIRRQHEPDYDAENDMNMSLLIPHTFEPLNIENAKGVLMESSSDENKDNTVKKGSKKKLERKKRPLKKGKEVLKNTKEIPVTPTKDVSTTTLKEKALSTNEVAILTRRMREKIRQEEKNLETSDSDTENIALSLRKDKSKKENEKSKPTKDADKGESSKETKEVVSEIQCNNVDSTEHILENKEKISDADQFTGFSAIDQNEISSYQKYMKFVYDKIVPADDDNSEETADSCKTTNDSIPPLINPEEPVELLECVPTMPIFDNESEGKVVKRSKKTLGKKKEEMEAPNPSVTEKGDKYTERHGWHCYRIDEKEIKLYQNCHIPLEKLPESFVETYLEYYDITARDNEDKEVDRLINLQTLNRSTAIKEGKSKGRSKIKNSGTELMGSEQDTGNISRVPSPAHSDHLEELSPSEDEGPNVDDELPPPVPLRTTENCIAKNSLMDENESESDGEGIKKIKQELIETAQQEATNESQQNPQLEVKVKSEQTEVRFKPGPKSKTRNVKKPVAEPPAPDSLMLTADKMMNKELSLLHAPVILKEEVKESSSKEPSPKDETKLKKKQSKIHSTRDRLKTEDDSSSEEEKQWVSTKEKLLKRMGKKEDAGADDAKRAKLVDDFIERRGVGVGQRKSHAGGRRRSRKNILERLKQQRVLSKELYGESSLDVTPGGKRGAASGPFKGRRNIRKVIDKKSLQKSTRLANLEEFERKRRLTARQNRLRELVGCEEGVNVLVINDEVCLEYDFGQRRPVVTVHPFFTKVMKAHQYEGVKFMWDACFESLEAIESGSGGGGCILAHCMGLGKTLQVLALLHTVLTHPRAGMARVLVCCPLSTVLNWVDEIHKWIGPVTNQIKVFELSKLKKTYERAYQLEDWYNGGGIFIIGYELFRSLTTLDPLLDDVRPTIINKIRTALLDPGPDIIICDEGHLLKNDCSVLAVAMSRVVTKRRIVLTGTPMQNNLREYYCMVNFVKPNLLGTYSEYSNRFENPIMNAQHRDSREEDIKLMKARTFILHKVLEGCLQRQEASVLYPYLPKKHEYTLFIQLTKCQWDLYKHYVHHYTKKSKQSVLKDFHILQKIWSHPQVLHNFQIKAREAVKKDVKAEKVEDDLALEDKEDIKPADTEVWWLQYLADGAMLDSLDSSNKFVAVFRILDECIALGDKVLIFSTSLFCLDALEYFLKKINSWSLGQEYYRLDGSVPAEVRQKWCREFNADNNHKTKLFLISTRAGCLGLNMTAANRVIILDTSWNPAHDIQSIFRVYRFGQKKDCYIYRLVAMGTMEQKIYERSVTKQAVACRVVDEQQIDRHYNMAELTELYKFDEFGVGVAAGVAVGIGDVALLRVARDSAVHAVHEHDSLLRGSGEQGLPEHERDAAWHQFQQEHAHKQVQHDSAELELAKRAAEEQAMQALILQQQAQVLNIKTEDAPVHDSLLVPRPDQPLLTPAKGKGGVRGRGRRPNIVQCRIPIKAEAEGAGAADDEETVRQISHILIKYNFTQQGRGPQQIQDLVNKVKRMIHNGEPMALEHCDELTASIANVLLRRQDAGVRPPGPSLAPLPLPPALTDVAPEEPVEQKRGRGRPRLPVPDVPPVETNDPKRGRGRPKKSTTPIVQDPPPEEGARDRALQEMVEIEVGDRRRRRAAIAAERQFDKNGGTSQEPPEKGAPEPVAPQETEMWELEIGGRRRRKAPNAAKRQLDKDAGTSQGPPEKFAPNVAPEEVGELEIGGRRRRKAAIAAERQFDMDDGASQDSAPQVIDLDDDDWQGDVDSEPEIVPEIVTRPAEKEQKEEKRGRKKKVAPVTKPPADASILLSDDEELVAKPPAPKPAPVANMKREKVVPLHISLLTNESFVKIVAHTYLAGNPMLDEDAATLAAQYSTIKLLKEYESTGKPIESGPIHDIAIKVLGEEVLMKLHEHDLKQKDSPKEDSSASSSKLMQILGQGSAEPAAKKGEPKSKVKPVKEEPKEAPREMPKLGIPSANVTPSGRVVPVSLLRQRAATSAAPPPPPPAPAPAAPADECILPDDDDVHCVAAPAPPTPARHIKVKLGSFDGFRCTAGETAAPAPALAPAHAPAPAPTTPLSKIYTTICLDSDEDEPSVPTPAPAPAPPPAAQAAAPPPPAQAPAAGPPLSKARALRAARQAAQAKARLEAEQAAQTQPAAPPRTSPAPTGPAPVPIALTGPNSQHIPLHSATPGISPVPASAAPPAPISNPSGGTFGPGLASGPVPVAMTGPVPVALSGPGFRAIPIAMSKPAAPPRLAYPAQYTDLPPVSSAGPPPAPYAPYTAAPPARYPGPPSISQPRPAGPTSTAADTPRPVSVSYASGGMRTLQLSAIAPAASRAGVAPSIYLMPAPARALCRPGDVLRLTKSGQLEVVSASEVHTIDDDEPAPVVAPAPASAPPPVKTPPGLKPQPIAPKLTTSASDAPASKGQAKIIDAPTPKPDRPVKPAPRVETPPVQAGRPRKSRMISSSSSSSSSSRSASPDPLSILRDVVHIQAPDRRRKAKPPDPKPAPKPKPTDKRKEDAFAEKLNTILSSVAKLKKASASKVKAGSSGSSGSPLLIKSAPNKVSKMQDSIDLTEITFKSMKADAKSTSKAVSGSVKKDGPTTVVGTSKNIVLDGKSKALTNKSMVDLTGQKNVQVTNVKSIPSSSKPKLAEKKRPAPTPEIAPKKKKTELMTLKDFDIDDIDDIIELD